MTFEIEWGGLHTVISGGQTGADQGGLLAAWRYGVQTGGQAPANYRTIDGYNPLLQVLGLTAAGNYEARTKANIRNSDGTVIIAHDLQSSGSALTRVLAHAAKKPLMVCDIADIVACAGKSFQDIPEGPLDQLLGFSERLATFVTEYRIQVLNVAGNRELENPLQPVTSTVDWLVSCALEILDQNGKLILKSSSQSR